MRWGVCGYERTYTYISGDSSPVCKRHLESMLKGMLNVTMLKNLNSRRFDFCFVAVLIIPEFHNLPQLY